MVNIIVRVLVGLSLLILGRRLFWLFVGAIGFILGIDLASNFLTNQPEWVVLVIGLAIGIIGAVLAMAVQQVAVVVGGFVAGGVAALSLMRLLELQGDLAVWIPFIIGGIIGAILMGVLFDWALIILSSLTGAALIAETFQLESPFRLIVLLVLLAIGIGIQSGAMRRGG